MSFFLGGIGWAYGTKAVDRIVDLIFLGVQYQEMVIQKVEKRRRKRHAKACRRQEQEYGRQETAGSPFGYGIDVDEETAWNKVLSSAQLCEPEQTDNKSVGA
jgi:hypothetical protein